MTVNEVVMYCEDSDDDLDDNMDDFDKPIMDGSNDEFSDLEGDDLNEIKEDAVDSTPDTTVNSGSASLSSSSGSGSVDSALLYPSTPGSGLASWLLCPWFWLFWLCWPL